MDSKDPDGLIEEHKQNQELRGKLAKDALEWFLEDENVGRLFPRRDAIQELSDHMGVSVEESSTAISDTVGDIVDPVQQIIGSENKYVGIIEYHLYEDEGAYGYIDFDDRKGKRKRVVCARCVEKYDYDEKITHATQGEGSANDNASWQQLLNKVTSHYSKDHTQSPSNVEPGASLVSGTTISGNETWHAGNDGLGSGLKADEVEGKVNLVDENSRLIIPTGTDKF
jgi:hypothetical protein